MICKNCGKKMEYTERDYAPDTFDCECGEWIEAQMAFNEMKARAEKAKAELLLYKNTILPLDYLAATGVKPKELAHDPVKLHIYRLARRICDKEIKEIILEKEKAEGELKAIKDRIEKIHIDDICEITHHLIETLDTAESITLDEKIFNFIKQIGGEK